MIRGSKVMQEIHDGDELLISGEEIICEGRSGWRRGTLLTEAVVLEKMDAAAHNVKTSWLSL